MKNIKTYIIEAYNAKNKLIDGAKSGKPFTVEEIIKIVDIFNLSNDEVMSIFFASQAE